MNNEPKASKRTEFMKITYNKASKSWTIICDSNVDFGRILDCAIFAECKGDDNYAIEKRRQLLETRKELQTAFEKQ